MKRKIIIIPTGMRWGGKTETARMLKEHLGKRMRLLGDRGYAVYNPASTESPFQEWVKIAQEAMSSRIQYHSWDPSPFYTLFWQALQRWDLDETAYENFLTLLQTENCELHFLTLVNESTEQIKAFGVQSLIAQGYSEYRAKLAVDAQLADAVEASQLERGVKTSLLESDLFDAKEFMIDNSWTELDCLAEDVEKYLYEVLNV